jgi:hypothetical protein
MMHSCTKSCFITIARLNGVDNCGTYLSPLVSLYVGANHVVTSKPLDCYGLVVECPPGDIGISSLLAHLRSIDGTRQIEVIRKLPAVLGKLA